MRAAALLLPLIGVLAALLAADAAPAPEHELRARFLSASQLGTPPDGYRYSWGIDKNRLAYSGSDYLARSQISSSQTLSSREIAACGARCEATVGCGFFHPIRISGGSAPGITCALFRQKQAKSAATSTKGPSSTGGSVVDSYGYTRNAGAVTAPSTTRTSTTRTSTTTTSTTRTSTTTATTTSSSTAATSTSTSAVPAPPAGVDLVQYAPCVGISATVPLFVSHNAYTQPSLVRTAYLVMHGNNREGDKSFVWLAPYVGGATNPAVLIVSPQLNNVGDAAATGPSGSSYYQPAQNLAWDALGTGDLASNSQYSGADAAAPSSGPYSLSGSQCSSFQVFDSLLSDFADRSKYPLLSQVFVVGHSAGAGMVLRYAQLSSDTAAGTVPVRYVGANAASHAYFTTDRPLAPASNCTTYNTYQWGFASSFPRYVAQRVSTLGGATAIFRRFVARDVVTMTGDSDTYALFHYGAQDCNVQAQGGVDRRDRG
jgi:hypothetical protein